MRSHKELLEISKNSERLYKEIKEFLVVIMRENLEISKEVARMAALQADGMTVEDHEKLLGDHWQVIQRTYNNYELVGPILSLFMAYPWEQTLSDHSNFIELASKSIRCFEADEDTMNTLNELIVRSSAWPTSTLEVDECHKELHSIFNDCINKFRAKFE